MDWKEILAWFGGIALLVFAGLGGLSLLLSALPANAQEVTMSAEVKYTNCNIQHSYMPAPQITYTWQNSYGYNFIAQVGSSTLYAYRGDNIMHYFLDDAYWYYTPEEGVVYGECITN